MQSFNKWFLGQFVKPVDDEEDEEDKNETSKKLKLEKKHQKRKQKYVNRKSRMKVNR